MRWARDGEVIGNGDPNYSLRDSLLGKTAADLQQALRAAPAQVRQEFRPPMPCS